MMNTLRKVAVAASIACMVPAASADVLNFDNLVGTNFFLSNYQGFQLGTNNIANTAWFYTNEVSTYYTPHSGASYVATDFQLYTGALFEDTQPISSTTPFVFQGAWFSGGDAVFYKLYNGSTLVSTSAVSPTLGSVPLFVSSGYTGAVTSVVISGRQGYYAMDDFTFAPVPEPGTYAMLMAGLLGVGAVVRRRNAA